MKRVQSVFALFLALAAGFAGGALSGGIRSAQAQVQESFWPQRVQAKSFVVVDDHGHKRAEMAVSKNGKTFLRLYDEDGRTTWSADETNFLPLVK